MEKRMIWLGAAIGSVLGGMVPGLWGAGSFSMSGIICGTVGAVAGIWVMFKLTRY